MPRLRDCWACTGPRSRGFADVASFESKSGRPINQRLVHSHCGKPPAKAARHQVLYPGTQGIARVGDDGDLVLPAGDHDEWPGDSVNLGLGPGRHARWSEHIADRTGRARPAAGAALRPGSI